MARWHRRVAGQHLPCRGLLYGGEARASSLLPIASGVDENHGRDLRVPLRIPDPIDRTPDDFLQQSVWDWQRQRRAAETREYEFRHRRVVHRSQVQKIFGPLVRDLLHSQRTLRAVGRERVLAQDRPNFQDSEHQRLDAGDLGRRVAYWRVYELLGDHVALRGHLLRLRTLRECAGSPLRRVGADVFVQLGRHRWRFGFRRPRRLAGASAGLVGRTYR
mmetsp:Transcript_108226/g.304998  ORF Transcript_108226/g.304998 Transcript_108226/m.304998 type:complete len:218 (-) Transcript_108226:411-1064(-)